MPCDFSYASKNLVELKLRKRDVKKVKLPCHALPHHSPLNSPTISPSNLQLKEFKPEKLKITLVIEKVSFIRVPVIFPFAFPPLFPTCVCLCRTRRPTPRISARLGRQQSPPQSARSTRTHRLPPQGRQPLLPRYDAIQGILSLLLAHPYLFFRLLCRPDRLQQGGQQPQPQQPQQPQQPR